MTCTHLIHNTIKMQTCIYVAIFSFSSSAGSVTFGSRSKPLEAVESRLYDDSLCFCLKCHDCQCSLCLRALYIQ